jgi:ACS family tartrate transporter-like MFS transporter
LNETLNEVGFRTRKKIAIRLLPLVLAMYVVCYIDRANVSFANLRMSADLGMSPRSYGFGVGIFFIGYVLFEIPGAIIVERWSARKWMARIMITWGLLTILSAFVQTPRQFYIARFLIGLSEASFFPGIIVYLTHWFRTLDRAKAIACFYIGVPGATVVGSVAASWLLGAHWRGLAGWRWLFVVEGIPPIVLGLTALLYLTDWPREARWLQPEEREWITLELEAETKAKKQVRNYTVWQAFRDRHVLLLMIGWFLALAATLGSLYWLPAFIKRLSALPDSQVALLAAIPGVVGIVGTLFNGWHSDKVGERRWHAALPVLVAGALYLLLLLPGVPTAVAIAMMTLGLGLYYALQPVFWAIPTLILCESAAAASFGLINSIGQIGGFAGPYIVGYLNQTTGNLRASLFYIGACYILSGGVISLLKVRMPSADRNVGSIVVRATSAQS